MNRTTTIIALAIAAILGLGAFYYTSTGATSEQATMSTDDSTTETATDEAAADLPPVEEMTLGNPDAPVNRPAAPSDGLTRHGSTRAWASYQASKSGADAVSRIVYTLFIFCAVLCSRWAVTWRP